MIREARKEDYLAICKICTEDLGYECRPELVLSRLESLDKNRERVFVADIDGVVVGFVHVEKYIVLYCESIVNIQGLAVAHNFRKMGLGRNLMKSAETWAADNGIHLVRLNSGITRTGAHEFYRNIGYGHEKKQIRFLKELQ